MSRRTILKTGLSALTMVAACLCLGSHGFAAEPIPASSTVHPQEFVIKCVYTKKPIKIDGHLSELAWKLAEPLDFHSIETAGAPISKTVGRVLWDDKYLYIGYRAYDKDIWAYSTKRDSWCYQEDCLEAFFKTDPDKEPYYNMEINALGTIHDSFTYKKGAGGEDNHRWIQWNCAGLKIGTFVKGTLNNPYDVDQYWQREMAIPFADLPTLKGMTPKPGDKWKILLGRYDYSVYLDKGEEISSCVPHKVDDFHDSHNWVTLEFVK